VPKNLVAKSNIPAIGLVYVSKCSFK